MKIKNKNKMKSNKIITRNVERGVLTKIAKRSKMDCWFYIDDDYNVLDLDNGSRKMNDKKAIKLLLEGATPYDLETLTPQDIYYLIGITLKII